MDGTLPDSVDQGVGEVPPVELVGPVEKGGEGDGVETGVEGVTVTCHGTSLIVKGDHFKGVQGAQDILSALQPTHSDLVIRSSLVELGEEGFQSLLRDLRSRSRSRAGKWADFCLDSVAIFISGSDSTEQSELDRFVDVSRWCLPAIIKAFFQTPSDFPHLAMINIGAYWSWWSDIESVERVVSDPRLMSLRLDQSVGHPSVIKRQLQCVLERIERQHRSLEEVGVMRTGRWGPRYVDRLPGLEDLVLEVVRTGSRGPGTMHATDEWLFALDGRLPDLVAAVKGNTFLYCLSVWDQGDVEGSPPLDAFEHLDKNYDRVLAIDDALLSIVVPARVLLHARPATPSSDKDVADGTHRDQKRRASLLSLPPEVLHLILVELSVIVADERAQAREDMSALDFPELASLANLTQSGVERPQPAELWDMILYASDMSTVRKEKRRAWSCRLLWERKWMRTAEGRTAIEVG